ncbi:2-oxo-4-hydroxy-4-carboxy-5-ureidoimidazoline decarboxylase [Halobacillus salinarum]|uniref:2-oxo-4-hydroxy-4-carboxy-5-ureidoimidazoline decarboxylase n=1 Tax=Halobacillus salinarum TaxID=2932257 RepID=A0ABY4EHU7_9BACI|nr:2-oxo-4-hydroxy-4-carboxy-5-ureidoimidazoline decarboxylase [Halobacillus salinarum]UOQ43696.1 2-oxo-4-hydroxy-4-carboxy-5-ureidoimidazoline decarboxylase [Halobacillus salinarum]
MPSLQSLNEANEKNFTNCLSGIFENSPWVAKKVLKFRPFHSVHHLHERMVQIVAESPLEEQLELIRSHPHLGAAGINMSEDSVNEQLQAGLKNLSQEDNDSFQQLNQAYLEKFDFPFIFAVKGKDKSTVHKVLEERLTRSPAIEFETALCEIYQIAMFRLEDKLSIKGDSVYGQRT